MTCFCVFSVFISNVDNTLTKKAVPLSSELEINDFVALQLVKLSQFLLFGLRV